MKLSEYFNRFSIEGIQRDTLKSILNHDTNNTVRVCTPGTILITGTVGRKIVHCVDKYYTNDTNGKKIKVTSSSTSDYVKCNRVLQAFGINGRFDPGMCQTCHLICMREEDYGTLNRLINKK